MVAISTSTTASMVRMPKRWRPSSNRTSRPVITTAQNKRNVEEEIQRHRAAQYFGQVTGGNRRLAEEPVRPPRPPRIPLAAALRQVATGHHAEARRDDLHEDRHEAGETDDPKQVVLELRTRLQVGAPVAGVHVTDTDQDGGADEGLPVLPEAGLVVGHVDGAVHALERGMAARPSAVESSVYWLRCRICHGLALILCRRLRKFDRPRDSTLLFPFEWLGEPAQASRTEVRSAFRKWAPNRHG